MDFMATFSAISHAIEAAKSLREIERDFDVVTYKLQIADLATILSEAKLGLLDIRNDLDAKDEEIRSLKKPFEFRGLLTERSGFKDEVDESGQPFGLTVLPAL